MNLSGRLALGKNQVDEKIIEKISKALSKEDVDLLRHDTGIAPAWVTSILFSILKKIGDDRMVETPRRKKTEQVLLRMEEFKIDPPAFVQLIMETQRTELPERAKQEGSKVTIPGEGFL